VQLSTLVPTPRGGDIVLSAAPTGISCALRATPHVSTHGALRREQMMVPLLLDAPPARMPQRTRMWCRARSTCWEWTRRLRSTAQLRVTGTHFSAEAE
jgi:hypothetical protein